MSIVEMKVPVIGESISEVTLSQWLIGNGDYVKLDEPICEFESDKATLEFPAEAAGKLIHVAAEDDDLEIGALVAKIDTSVAPPQSTGNSDETTTVAGDAPQTTDTPEVPTAFSSATTYASGHPSPSAAKILREKDIDPTTVKGTGINGRITKEDAQKSTTSPSSSSDANAKHSPVQTIVGERNIRREKMSRMRRTIASRLVSTKNNTAMLTTFNEIDMSAVMKLRKTYQERFVEKHGIKLGFMSLFAKACAKVLMEKPDVNAALDGNEIVYHDYADISIAISTPTGLVVPPVHNVERLGFHEVEFKIKELAEKARSGKLTLDEMKGGTFTITNGGVFGSLMSTPIINEPQSAILGMHNIVQRPVAVNGEVVVRPMMYIALSYDHRVIDGSTSVTFLVRVKELLEDPMTLMMDI
jgi:2-oxoglutarate dehydrogenase E2 component (dihydrolipoamide succinyltransferase)